MDQAGANPTSAGPTPVARRTRRTITVNVLMEPSCRTPAVIAAAVSDAATNETNEV